MKYLCVFVVVIITLVAPARSGETINFGWPDGQAHPNVGALVAEWLVPGQKDVICSGTLIAPQVFLTAAHCTAYLESLGITQVWVTFDTQFDRSSPNFFSGAMYTNPAYNWRQADPGDIAVVILDTPSGETPADLPSANLLDQMSAKNGLKRQAFTSVGYGASQLRIGGGPPSYTYLDKRKYAISTFSSLNLAWIHLSQNPATGDSGACYGDSGGPIFIGAYPNDRNVYGRNTIVAITITGDAMCRATNVVYRLDTPSARNFLGTFVTLP